MVFGFLPPFAVLARSSINNNPRLEIEQHQRLGETLMPSSGGDFRHNPGLEVADDPIDGQVTMSWDIDGINLDSYELVFPLTGGQIARLNFIRTEGAAAWVTYRVYTGGVGFHATGAAAPQFLPGSGLTEISYPNFRLNVGTATFPWQANFYPVRGEGTIPALPRSPIDLDDDTSDPGLLYHPSDGMNINPDYFVVLDSPFPFFGIQEGYGFSFTLGQGAGAYNPSAQHAVSFLWDDGRFYVTTGGLETGHIYEFFLSRLNGNFTAPDLSDPAGWAANTPAWWGNFSNTLDTAYLFAAGQLARPTIFSLQRVFTGFITRSRPLARHRHDPRPGNPGTGPVDRLFFEAGTPTPPPAIPNRQIFPPGFTNWDLPDGGGGDALWDGWNVLYRGSPEFQPGGSTNRVNDLLPVVEPMLSMYVELPRVWSPASSSFGPPPTGTAVTSPSNSPITTADFGGLDVSVLLSNIGIGNEVITEIRFSVDDIFRLHGASGTIIDSVVGSPNTEDTWVEVRERTAGGVITGVDMHIHNIPESQIFDPTVSSINMFQSATANFPADVHIGGYANWISYITDAYTFPRYRVEYIGGNFHVRVTPFHGHLGTYRVYALIDGFGGPLSIAAPVRVPEGMVGDYIFMPLHVWALDMPIDRLQVVFYPDDTNFDGPVHSQVIYFMPTFDRVLFTVPNDFQINPDTPELFLVDPTNPDNAEFNTVASWDIGVISSIGELFEDINRGRGGASQPPLINMVTLRYLIQSYDTPTPIDSTNGPHQVAWVDVDIIRYEDPVTGNWHIRWEVTTDVVPETAPPPSPPTNTWPSWLGIEVARPWVAARQNPDTGNDVFELETFVHAEGDPTWLYDFQDVSWTVTDNNGAAVPGVSWDVSPLSGILLVDETLDDDIVLHIRAESSHRGGATSPIFAISIRQLRQIALPPAPPPMPPPAPQALTVMEFTPEGT